MFRGICPLFRLATGLGLWDSGRTRTQVKRRPHDIASGPRAADVAVGVGLGHGAEVPR